LKATLEIPDPIFRRAKSVAAERGIPFREFVTEAVPELPESSYARLFCVRKPPKLTVASKKFEHIEAEDRQ
jgi:hypothetical protein